jgi:hypothetical protein
LSAEEVILKYLRLINTEYFAKYEKDFARRIQMGLIDEYQQKQPEPKMVSSIEKIINNLKIPPVSIDRINISTRSIFIHGRRSLVEFEYYGQNIQKELGDLIFILSVIYKGRKYFEKFTISQFKKDDEKIRWDLSNREQIYLLSRFPPFRGVKGSIIPMREFNLPNYSGCLGSFNLLFRPRDFIFVSAPLLKRLVGNRKYIGIADVYKFWEPSNYYLTYPIHLSWLHMEKLLYFLWKLWNNGLLTPFFPPYFIGILGFSHFSPNIHEFVDDYLRGNIGELIYSYIGKYKTPALDFLHELLSAIMRKAQREGRTEIMDFVNEFFRYPYGNGEGGLKESVEFDYEGGGIGIIYTSINLGEE